MKKVSLVGWIGLLLVAIFSSSCARKAPKTATHEIEFMNWERTPEGRTLISKLIEEFEKENPGIKVKNTIVAGSYSSKLPIRITLPELTRLVSFFAASRYSFSVQVLSG